MPLYLDFVYILRQLMSSNLQLWSVKINWHNIKTCQVQCDQIGLFLKGLGHFHLKIAQLYDNFLDYFERCHYLSENYFPKLLWGNVRKNSATFYSIIWSHWSQVQTH